MINDKILQANIFAGKNFPIYGCCIVPTEEPRTGLCVLLMQIKQGKLKKLHWNISWGLYWIVKCDYDNTLLSVHELELSWATCGEDGVTYAPINVMPYWTVDGDYMGGRGGA